MSYDDHEIEDQPIEVDEIEAPAARRTGLRGRNQVDAEEPLRRVADLVAAARPMPLSASAMINKENAAVLLEDELGAIEIITQYDIIDAISA